MTPIHSSDVDAGGPFVFWSERRPFFWGRSSGDNPNLHDAIAAAVDKAGLPEGTHFTVVHTEVESVGDPRPGAYNVILSAGPGD